MAGANDAKQRKHLPKRAMNKNLQARRAASWARGQRRKAARIAAAKAAWEANEEYRQTGLPTPYEQRRAEQREAYEAGK